MIRISEISDYELYSFTYALKKKYGIDFTLYEKRSLKRGLSRMMNKNQISSILELWKILLEDGSFIHKCIDDLTVNLTELFRNPEIWIVLPNIINQFSNKIIINIWHAGCSTGEEVYSMAMIAKSKNLLHKTRFLGTDLSKSALAKASKGKYSKELIGKYKDSMKKSIHEDFHDMFNMNTLGAEIKPELKKYISFKKHNLVSEEVNKTYDLIFCRNVMIYFDEELKIKVLSKLVNALNPNGYLILGYYDAMPDRAYRFIKRYDTKNRIYQKI